MLKTNTARILRLVLILGISFLVAPISGTSATSSDREAMFAKYLDFASYIKGGTIIPHWLADGNAFWYAQGAPDNTIIYRVDPGANAKLALFDSERLRKALTPILGHEPPYKGLPFESFAFSGEKMIQFSVENKTFLCDLQSYTITSVPSPSPEEAARFAPRVFTREYFLAGRQPASEVLSPDQRWFASVKDYNLWLRSTYDGREERLTTDGVQGYEWDVEGLKWMPWSPNGLKLAVFKTDYRKVLRIPNVHWLKTNLETEWIYTVNAGGPLPKSELAIVDILSKKQVHVEIGDETDCYLTIVGWLPDGSELIFARFDRAFKKVEVMAADPSTGVTRIVLTESQPTFIRLQHSVIYANEVGMTLLPDGKRFIWTSERDGWNHLYLYDLKGNLIRRLTQGTFPVLRVMAIDEKEGWVYYSAHGEERLYDTHLYRVSLEGKGFKRVTEAKGQHDAQGLLAALLGLGGVQFSPSKKFFIDSYSSVEVPPTVELRKADGTLLQTLATANIDGLRALKWSAPEEFVVKAADNSTDLHGVLYKPYDFDPNRKYPVIEYIYGGPMVLNVPRDFGHNARSPMQAFPRALAQLGYVVFIVDARGTPERSKAFQDVVYGNFGRNEIPDHAAALKQLGKERPYLDLNRVGIFGWSWGGYFTFRALTLAPDSYHVGVCGAPGFSAYNLMLYEPYLGLPQNNKDAYDYCTCFWLADKLKGKILFVNGTSDWATLPDTIRMIEALVRAGKSYDLILLPEQGHGPTGKSMTYYIEGAKRYFLTHLPPEAK
jgi:dipeptidyl aminopeptidase/acylaminoacyl peptidase